MTAPTSLRVEACSLCQLRCVLCPTRERTARSGGGKLKLGDFKRLIDANPHIKKIELGGRGEAFLNEDLPEIIRCAFERDVATSIGGGANLNDVSDAALTALVRYGTLRLRCAVDGVTQETYQKYRVGGNLRKVIGNIERINTLKARYRSSKPRLIFQFIVFGHNQHEIEQAAVLARMLKMEFFVRLNYSTALSVRDRNIPRQYTGYADRAEYLQREGRHYRRSVCRQLWLNPQIGWDGSLLGCSCNGWGAYPGNVFEQGLMECVSGQQIAYARDMLMGKEPPRPDLPCAHCECYQSMAASEDWITQEEIHGKRQGASPPET